MEDLEQHLSVEPAIIETFLKLTRDLGSATCNDWTSCFALTKRLRDELDLSEQIKIWNSENHALESRGPTLDKSRNRTRGFVPIPHLRVARLSTTQTKQ